MNWAHVHLLLNHIPVIGMLFAVLLLIVAMVKKSEAFKVLSLQFFVLLTLLTIPTYLTGDPAAEVVRSLPGVTREIIERHDDAATIALIGMILIGVLALAGLIINYRTKSLPTWVVTLALVLSLVEAGWLAWTANLGGQIRHTEIRAGFRVGPTSASPEQQKLRQAALRQPATAGLAKE